MIFKIKQKNLTKNEEKIWDKKLFEKILLGKICCGGAWPEETRMIP